MIFDWNLLVILFLTELCVLVGGNWSGLVRYRLQLKEEQQPPIQKSELAKKSKSLKNKESKKSKNSCILSGKDIDNQSSLEVSYKSVFCYVIMMSVFLMAMYMFFNYLIYIVLGLFFIGSVGSSYTCFEPIANHILPKAFLDWKLQLPCNDKWRVKLVFLILTCLALSVGLSWFLNRHNPCGWIFHNFAGVCFIIGALKNIRLPNFRIIFLLLSLLFVYDVFFVFVTPLMTKDGTSVMVRVAGGKVQENRTITSALHPSLHNHTLFLPNQPTNVTKRLITSQEERIPMLFRLPYVQGTSREYCYTDQGFLLLGYGDVLVPGVLVSYANFHDRYYQIAFRPYYFLCCFFYGIGLIITSIFVYLMNGAGQPALLYLVPATVLPVICLALWRQEFWIFWRGPVRKKDWSQLIATSSSAFKQSDLESGGIEHSANTAGAADVEVSPPQSTNKEIQLQPIATAVIDTWLEDKIKPSNV